MDKLTGNCSHQHGTTRMDDPTGQCSIVAAMTALLPPISAVYPKPSEVGRRVLADPDPDSSPGPIYSVNGAPYM